MDVLSLVWGCQNDAMVYVWRLALVSSAVLIALSVAALIFLLLRK